MSPDGAVARRDKRAAQATVAAWAPQLTELSHRIHAHPELGFAEVQAAAWCTEALRAGGFDVRLGVGGLATAFQATVGSGPLEIGICCEYDALPEIGHACGHNIIAAAGVGAGLALAPLADALGCTFHVLGTPAEEGGGGKILLLEAGVFDGLGACLMVHPAPAELVQMPCLAIGHFDVRFVGKEAHASAFPELGINAADALTISQVAVGLLRQHAKPGDQVHGIVTNGGAAPNIVPGLAEAKYYVRSATLAGLTEWEARVRRCFEAGALASGCSVEFITRCPPYSEFQADEAIGAVYRANAESLGRVFSPPSERVLTASTDMANVSLAIPAIHPTLDIDSAPAVNHQPEFAAHCVTPAADRAVLDGATAMAWTVIDLARDENARQRLLRAALPRS